MPPWCCLAIDCEAVLGLTEQVRPWLGDDLLEVLHVHDQCGEGLTIAKQSSVLLSRFAHGLAMICSRSAAGVVQHVQEV